MKSYCVIQLIIAVLNRSLELKTWKLYEAICWNIWQMAAEAILNLISLFQRLACTLYAITIVIAQGVFQQTDECCF